MIILCFFVLVMVILWGTAQNKIWAAAISKAPNGVLANGVGEKIVLSWEPVTGADGYEVYEKNEEQKQWTMVKAVSGKKVVLKYRQPGVRYYYKIRAYQIKTKKIQYGKFSKKVDTTLPKNGTTTLRNFLKTALAPVGSTMYIWGGGWNKEDTGAGTDALRIGLNPKWRTFASAQKSTYEYKKYRYRRGYGLDCSGFVGWTLFNVFHTTKGNAGEGYVDKAKNLAKNCAEKGWGSFQKASSVTDYQAGDIMSGPGHVYIVLGECADGSVVLVHSSPAGVQICGTVTPQGEKNSKAIQLAKTYMKSYYPSWYRRFPNCSRDLSYLTKYGQFRWSTAKGNPMEDPENYQEKSAKAILKDLFES